MCVHDERAQTSQSPDQDSFETSQSACGLSQGLNLQASIEWLQWPTVGSQTEGVP